MAIPAVLRFSVWRVLPVFLLVPLSGCLVVSLQPVYDEQHVVYEEGLIGTWKEADGDATLVVTRGAWNAYELAYTEGTDTTRVSGFLTRVGQSLLLDVTTAAGVEEPPVTVQAHWAFLADLRGDALTLRAMEFDWFKAHAGEKAQAPLGIAPDVDGNRVMTASTQVLRDWLARHATNSAIWDEPMVFARQKTFLP
jgi:hypothetical protein